MDGLRWILLVIGIVLIAGIYLVDRYKRRAAYRNSDAFLGSDEHTDLNIPPRPADHSDDYQDALTGLNRALNENRQSASSAVIDEELAMAWQDDDKSDEAGTGDVAPEQENVASESAPADERLIVFYLKAPSGQAFAGPGLFEALDAAGLSLGTMGIFHDTDSQGRIIFSVANIFEPGTLDIDDIEQFSTRGVALFMQLPLSGDTGPADETDAFERMLGKTEILAERLGGELQDEHHQPLDNAGVMRARDKLKTA